MKIKIFSIRFIIIILVIVAALAGLYIYKYEPFKKTVQINDNLDNNIFPSLVISTATTDTIIVPPSESIWIGNPKSVLSLAIETHKAPSTAKITIRETKYSYESVSEYKLNNPNTKYNIYPEINWKYEELKNNSQPTPISFSIVVEMGKEKYETIYTMSMRSINECMTSYIDKLGKKHDTSILFTAYINEDNPLIDKLLREALNTRIVNRFWGYQSKKANVVDTQVYALWHILQMRNFKYSSISNSSFSSNKVSAQKVRTFEDAIESAQINCVDGSVMFASLLKAINIDPVLIKIPGHMFVGYYLDKKHKELAFIETSMIGDVNLDEYFPEEQLDSTMTGKSQKQISRIMFEKSKEYAQKKFEEYKEDLYAEKKGYKIIDVATIRKRIQPIGL